MKVSLFLISGLFFTFCNAQQFDCKQKSKEYKTLFNINDIKNADLVWNEVRINCKTELVGIYEDGLAIMQAKIDQTKSPEEKERIIREALKLYDDYNKYFPLQSTDYEVGKAMMIYYNSVRADQQMDEVFSLLQQGFSKASEKIKDVNSINLYFSLNFAKFKTKQITAQTITEKYLLVCAMLNRLQNDYPNNIKANKIVHAKIDAMAKSTLTCDGLSSYYEKELNTNKQNTKWLSDALNVLSYKCATQPIFYKLATTLYQINLDSQSAIFMGIATMNQKKYTEAISYYEKAASLEPNDIKKALLYFSLASQLTKSDKTNAKKYLDKAIQVNPKLGKAYLLKAQLYSTSSKECSANYFDKKALNYLAITTANQASETDPKLTQQVTKFVTEITKEALTTKDIRKAKMIGKSYTIGCWINETINFPNN